MVCIFILFSAVCIIIIDLLLIFVKYFRVLNFFMDCDLFNGATNGRTAFVGKNLIFSNRPNCFNLAEVRKGREEGHLGVLGSTRSLHLENSERHCTKFSRVGTLRDRLSDGRGTSYSIVPT